jgi:hypothetical protein
MRPAYRARPALERSRARACAAARTSAHPRGVADGLPWAQVVRGLASARARAFSVTQRPRRPFNLRQRARWRRSPDAASQMGNEARCSIDHRAGCQQSGGLRAPCGGRSSGAARDGVAWAPPVCKALVEEPQLPGRHREGESASSPAQYCGPRHLGRRTAQWCASEQRVSGSGETINAKTVKLKSE